MDQGNQAGLNGQQNMGTEYTLQGVMRFLQTEWHRHERERNQWEIERAEMRARIAKLEGENNAAKRLQQGYLKRVKMLEIALKKERAKSQTNTNGRASETSAQSDNLGGLTDKHISDPNSILDPSNTPFRTEAARQKSRAYLNECLKEITYLLLPPSHPAPTNNVTIDPITGQPVDTSSQKQGFVIHRGAQMPQQSQGQYASQTQSTNAQQSNSLPFSNAHQKGGQGTQIDSRQEENAHPSGPRPLSVEDPVEKISHHYNSFGEPLDNEPDTRPSPNASLIAMMEAEDPFAATAGDDVWDFDDGSKSTTSKESGTISSDDSSFVRPQTGGERRNSASARRKSMSRRRSSQDKNVQALKAQDGSTFKVKYALRGHLDVVRAIVFTGSGTSSEPEICTAGDDGVIKRWTVPGGYMGAGGADVDVQSHFTHRGHAGMVTCLASSSAAAMSSLASEDDGWIFSGGVDTTVKVWEKGRIDAKATLVGHTDAVWAVCVIPNSGIDDRITIASGAADGTVRVWRVSAPPTRTSPRSMRSTISPYESGSALVDDFTYSLVTTISRESTASPTCISPLAVTGETFIVSYSDASIIIYDTQTGEELASMSSLESYDGSTNTGVNAVVATTLGLGDLDGKEGVEEEVVGGGATGGTKSGVAGVVISGTEDRYIRFYDANSGQCTYNMLAHPAAISALALSPDTRELVSAGHDASLRFWSMEKRSCTQEITSHRLMRGEGVCAVVWSGDGRWVISGGGDGVVKVFGR